MPAEQHDRPVDLVVLTAGTFDPMPVDAESARVFGQVSAAVLATGRTPRRRVADPLIATTAVANGLPLYTTNPSDFLGLGRLLAVVPLPRPPR